MDAMKIICLDTQKKNCVQSSSNYLMLIFLMGMYLCCISQFTSDFNKIGGMIWDYLETISRKQLSIQAVIMAQNQHVFAQIAEKKSQ